MNVIIHCFAPPYFLVQQIFLFSQKDVFSPGKLLFSPILPSGFYNLIVVPPCSVMLPSTHIHSHISALTAAVTQTQF